MNLKNMQDRSRLKKEEKVQEEICVVQMEKKVQRKNSASQMEKEVQSFE